VDGKVQAGNGIAAIRAKTATMSWVQGQDAGIRSFRRRALSGGDVEQSVAQGFGFCCGQFAGQGEEP
jgi:hypothetical protein